MATAPVTLVKSGQVGRAVLENLVQNSTGAQALLEAAKRVSECKPDVGGPLPEDATPLKTMKQTFMDESQKPAVIEAFIPLRRPQGASQVRWRESLDITDLQEFTASSPLGKFVLPSGTLQQVSGMTNAKNLMFSFNGDIPNSAMNYLWYDKAAGAFVVKASGIIYFTGQLNLAMLPAVVTTAGGSTTGNRLPYQNPTFLGTRGSNETEYRLSYHHYTAEQATTAIPDIFRTDTLFEGKFSHYDAAKMTEKRHGFTFMVRCNAGDRIHFILERGRSIVNYAGEQDLIRCVHDLSHVYSGSADDDFFYNANVITAVLFYVYRVV